MKTFAIVSAFLGTAIAGLGVITPPPVPNPYAAPTPNPTCQIAIENPNWNHLCCREESPYCVQVDWKSILCQTPPEDPPLYGYKYREVVFNDYPSNCIAGQCSY